MTQLDAFPPHQAHSSASRAAAGAIVASRETLRERVLAALERSPQGLSDEQMQFMLAMNPSTQRPRRVELVRAGIVKDSNIRVRTLSGRLATLWVLS